MARLGLIAWLCLGAFGLGLLCLEAARRKRPIQPRWVLLALALGPVFLFFVVPLWLGRWGKNSHQIEKDPGPHRFR